MGTRSRQTEEEKVIFFALDINTQIDGDSSSHGSLGKIGRLQQTLCWLGGIKEILRDICYYMDDNVVHLNKMECYIILDSNSNSIAP